MIGRLSTMALWAVTQMLQDAGPGSHVMVFGYGDNPEGGHYFNAVNKDVTRNPIQFISEPLIEFRGVTAWAHHTLVAVAKTSAEIKLIASARRLALPPK